MNKHTNPNLLTIDDIEGFTVSIHLYPIAGWGRRTKTRIYVSGEEAVDFTEAYAMQRANEAAYAAEHPTRPFYGRGEFPEEDKLFAKLNRQVVKNQRAVIDELSAASEQLDSILATGGKLTFSRTAGCSCGCSAGFVPEDMLMIDGRQIEALFITKKKEN